MCGNFELITKKNFLVKINPKCTLFKAKLEFLATLIFL